MALSGPTGESTIAAHAARGGGGRVRAVTLYSTWFCPFAQRGWIAAEELGVDYEWVEVELYEGGAHTKVLQHSNIFIRCLRLLSLGSLA